MPQQLIFVRINVSSLFRPRTLHREIKLLCMTIMCTWNSSLASVLKKGENRCHRKISAQFCFLSRWVGVLKYLFWLWSGSMRVSRQTSSPGIDELQRGNRDRDCSVLPGGPGGVAEQVTGVPIYWVREVSLCLSISIHLHCFVHEPLLPLKWSSRSQSFMRPWPPAEGLEGLSAWWESCSCWVTAKSPLWLVKWHIIFCVRSGGVFLNTLLAVLELTLNWFKFIKHQGICRFLYQKSDPRGY